MQGVSLFSVHRAEQKLFLVQRAQTPPLPTLSRGQGLIIIFLWQIEKALTQGHR